MNFTRSAALASLLLLASAGRAADSPEQHFEERVKPLLDSRCVSCHGPDKVKGGLRMDSREALLAGGDSGPALVPGRPDDSLVLQAVLHTRPDLEMPPKEKLTAQDVAVLHRWIADGAPWPAPAARPAAAPLAAGERIGDAWSDPRNPIVRLFGGQRLDLWSLKPLQPPAPPAPAPRHSPPGNPIDRFFTAGPEADPRTLIRRLSFDLTGLPPTPEEVEAFVREHAAEQRGGEIRKAGQRESGRPARTPGPASTSAAYERLVDRLLASPRYGEHQARLWLDVVRYSDSNGFDWDEFRPQAWRFRDYVVRAFNADKPFDQFIREQLAGDELLAGPPATPAEQDLLIATGYLRLGPQDNSAPLFNEQDRARAEWMADLTETTGSAFLAMTFSCCRCHDHKYDPLSQADHFRLRAFFEPLKRADDLPLDLAAEQREIARQHGEIEAQMQPLSAGRDLLLAAARDRVRAERRAALNDEERRLLELAALSQSAEPDPKAAELAKKIEPSDDDAKKAFTEAEKSRFDELGGELARLKQQKRPYLHGLLATDQAEAPGPTHLLKGGDHKAPGDEVVPGFLSALDPNPAVLRAAASASTTGRRLTLADWIASPENPLTARVFVNRAWQSFFGRGLVGTPNDFGFSGERPSHPGLLDWLAAEFIRQGWSVKRLHRQIVTSAAYRQTSAAADVSPRHADQRLLTSAAADLAGSPPLRPPARRLSAEQLRDALLAVSGLLQFTDGGPPVWPELPPEILQANPAFLDDNAEKTKGWYPSPPERQAVRSLYVVQKRTVRVPFLETFDLPENSVSCARRDESTVAPQALSLLNSPLALEAARAFARRVEREAGPSPEAQIRRAFALACQRAPDAHELALCGQFLAGASLEELCRALLNANEFLYVD